MTDIFNVGPASLSDWELTKTDRYIWFVYTYQPYDYAANGLAISYDGQTMRYHDLSHGTHGLGDELLNGTEITVDDLESDNVLDPEFSPAVVAKVHELIGTPKQVSPIQVKLSEALTLFLNSPYRGEWQQQSTAVLTAGELRILVAHLTLNPIDEKAIKKRLGHCGTIEAADLFR